MARCYLKSNVIVEHTVCVTSSWSASNWLAGIITVKKKRKKRKKGALVCATFAGQYNLQRMCAGHRQNESKQLLDVQHNKDTHLLRFFSSCVCFICAARAA